MGVICLADWEFWFYLELVGISTASITGCIAFILRKLLR